MSNNINKMKKNLFSEEFNEFFENSFSNTLANFEKERVKSIKKSKILIITLIILVSIGLIYYFVYSGKVINDFEFNFAIVVSAYGMAYYISKIPISIYKENIKKKLYPQLLSFLGDFELIDSSDLNKKEELENYVKSLLLFDSYSDFSSDDILIGTYKDIKFKISEICLRRKNGKSTTTIFEGILLTFKSFKNFSSKTLIKEDCFNLSEELPRVNLEDPEFETLFNVYSDDQIESRRLITPAFMNRMLKCAKNKRGQLTVSFENNNVNIALYLTNDWFEVSVDKPATNIDVYRKVLLEIYDILSFIDDLKLDEDIGM